jgi:putative phosphoesterase
MIDAVHARAIVVLADCHIHPAKGIDWPRAALDAFKGADLFITLGDMGERVGLDALAGLAPVIGVVGRDDEGDPRTAARLRVLEAGGVRIGCVFDPLECGAALQIEPPIWAPAENLLALFGGPVDALLWASTHAPSIERVDGRLQLNPGSATLPSKNAPASFARLTLAAGAIEGEIVSLRTP